MQISSDHSAQTEAHFISKWEIYPFLFKKNIFMLKVCMRYAEFFRARSSCQLFDYLEKPQRYFLPRRNQQHTQLKDNKFSNHLRAIFARWINFLLVDHLFTYMMKSSIPKISPSGMLFKIPRL